MEIHGSDMVLHGTPPTKNEVLAVVKRFWPDLVVEDDVGNDDYFIYKNQRAAEIWEAEGWTEDDDADMIYVLPREDHMTMVIDDQKSNLFIVEAVQKEMQGPQMTALFFIGLMIGVCVIAEVIVQLAMRVMGAKLFPDQ